MFHHIRKYHTRKQYVTLVDSIVKWSTSVYQRWLILQFFGYFFKILQKTLFTEAAKIQRLKEAILKNAKQKQFENRNKNLGRPNVFASKLGGLSWSWRIEHLGLGLLTD